MFFLVTEKVSPLECFAIYGINATSQIQCIVGVSMSYCEHIDFATTLSSYIDVFCIIVVLKSKG